MFSSMYNPTSLSYVQREHILFNYVLSRTGHSVGGGLHLCENYSLAHESKKATSHCKEITWILHMLCGPHASIEHGHQSSASLID